MRTREGETGREEERGKEEKQQIMHGLPSFSGTDPSAGEVPWTGHMHAVCTTSFPSSFLKQDSQLCPEKTSWLPIQQVGPVGHAPSTTVHSVQLRVPRDLVVANENPCRDYKKSFPETRKRSRGVFCVFLLP